MISYRTLFIRDIPIQYFLFMKLNIAIYCCKKCFKIKNELKRKVSLRKNDLHPRNLHFELREDFLCKFPGPIDKLVGRKTHRSFS